MKKDHEYWMKKALRQAGEALEAGEFPVGCVIVYDGCIVATGKRCNTQNAELNEIDHAEIVALRDLAKQSGEIEKSAAVIYCTMEPCLMCFAAIILSGIRTIVYAYEDVMGGGTTAPLSELSPLYSGADITIESDVLRNESLDFFIRFFSNPETRYWENSLLERYTLAQAASVGK